MDMRKLGGMGMEVAPLMLGGNVFGWTIDEQASFRVLDAFVGAGMNFIDTADIYSTWVPGHVGGESETIIGNWMKKSMSRDKVVLATKVGGELGSGKKGLSKQHIVEGAEDSLRRLQTDRIDLYQSHFDDPGTALDETLGAYADLIQQGKVRAIGASNYTAERLTEALKAAKDNNLPTYQTLQPHYNLYDRSDYEAALEAVCVEHDLGVVPYFSLASGFLTGKYRSEDDLNKSPRGAGNKKYLNERGYKILAALDQVANETQSTPATVALAWLIARSSITAPIASATTVEQLQSLVAATKLELKQPHVELLNSASAY